MNIEVKSSTSVTATKSALGRVAKIVAGDEGNVACALPLKAAVVLVFHTNLIL
ncbi:MAG: hypothetical protein JKX91_13750 [Rhizobiaceae bacterium]|nr:hypothetical protein [Rhizobiaceae bacterium]